MATMEPSPQQLTEWVRLAWRAAATVGYGPFGPIEERRMEAACSELARLAYAAGADAELEACCEHADVWWVSGAADCLRNLRRSKPPSLKQQALNELEEATEYAANKGARLYTETIRRALKSLPDD